MLLASRGGRARRTLLDSWRNQVSKSCFSSQFFQTTCSPAWLGPRQMLARIQTRVQVGMGRTHFHYMLHKGQTKTFFTYMLPPSGCSSTSCSASGCVSPFTAISQFHSQCADTTNLPPVMLPYIQSWMYSVCS